MALSRLLCLQLSLFTLLSTTTSYDEDNTLDTLYYAYGAYCDESDLEDWSCKWCTDYHSNFDISSNGAGVINTHSLQAFIGYDTDNLRIVLSFRGTNGSFIDWIENLDSDEIAYAMGNASGYINKEFYSSWQELENGGLTTMIESMFAGYPGADILITGHSLGAALAQIAALEMKSNSVYNELDIGSVSTITFGSPRWCDEDIATFYDDNIDSNWRIVNEHDVVPTIPYMEMGYHHTATEIRYTDASLREYTVCDGTGEDLSGSDCYYYTTNVIDHSHYFNIPNSCNDDEDRDEEKLDRMGMFETTEYEFESTQTTKVTDKIVVKIQEGLSGLTDAAKWTFFIALGMGWILALFFCCSYYKVRKELKQRYRPVGPTNTYYAI